MTVTHGLTRGGKTAEYKIWLGIKKRCFNDQSAGYKYYGARGITMHPAWVDSFEQFFAWVGKRPTPKHSIERMDNDGHYEPGNVKWATAEEQANNKRNSLFIEYEGENKTLGQWATEKGLRYLTVWMRLDAGWPIEKLFSKSYTRGKVSINARLLTIDGKTLTVTQWTKEAGLTRGVIDDRLKRGWPLDELLKPVGKYVRSGSKGS